MAEIKRFHSTELAHYFLNEKVQILTRNGQTLTGVLIGFDLHSNILLSIVKKSQRKYDFLTFDSRVIFVRGDSLISLSATKN